MVVVNLKRIALILCVRSTHYSRVKPNFVSIPILIMLFISGMRIYCVMRLIMRT